MRVMEVPKFEIVVPTLIICSMASLAFGFHQFLNIRDETCVTKTFTWTGKNYITSNGVVRVNATFDWSSSNLTMVIWVNEDEDDFCTHDCIGLVFDKDGDGDLFDEIAYWLGAGNIIPPIPSTNRLADWGGIYTVPIQEPPKPSPYHNCTFTESGYTFNIGIPKTEINFTRPMFTHLCFFDQQAQHYAIISGGMSLPEARIEAVVWVQFEV